MVKRWASGKVCPRKQAAQLLTNGHGGRKAGNGWVALRENEDREGTLGMASASKRKSPTSSRSDPGVCKVAILGLERWAVQGENSFRAGPCSVTAYSHLQPQREAQESGLAAADIRGRRTSRRLGVRCKRGGGSDGRLTPPGIGFGRRYAREVGSDGEQATDRAIRTELIALARKMKRHIAYGASVAGGVPVISGLQEGLAGDELFKVCGILNGTCNFILSKIEATGADFDKTLAEAQTLGFAKRIRRMIWKGWMRGRSWQF